MNKMNPNPKVSLGVLQQRGSEEQDTQEHVVVGK